MYGRKIFHVSFFKMLSRFVIVALALCGVVQGFAPSSVRASRALRPRAKGDDAIVVVNEDSVKGTVAVVGAAAGFVLGGPVLAAFGAAGANYIANKVFLVARTNPECSLGFHLVLGAHYKSSRENDRCCSLAPGGFSSFLKLFVK